MITARSTRQSLTRLFPTITLPDEPSIPQAGPSRPSNRSFTTSPSSRNNTYAPEARMAKYPSPKNKKRLERLVTAKNFAQGLRDIPKDTTHTLLKQSNPTSTPLQQPGESPYSLISIRNTGKGKETGPSLEDLHQILGTPPEGPRYTEEYTEGYKKVVLGLNNAFVVGQMKRLAELLAVGGVGKTKEGWIKILMKSGGWHEPEMDPELLKVESEQVYDLTPAELFLFMRDTDMLRDMITNQKIQFSGVVDVNDASKRQLKAQGKGDRLLLLSGAIKSLRESVRRTMWQLEDLYGVEPSEGLIHVVSSVTGVHIESRMVKEGGYAASSTSRGSLTRVLDLLRLAILRASMIPAKTPIAVTPRSSPENTRQEYGYLPFQNPMSSPPPWETVTTPGAALFRIKKTSLWQARPGRMEFTHRDQELEKVEVENLRGGIGEATSLEEYVRGLWRDVEGETGESTTLTFGYILHHPTETENALTPPLPTAFALSEAKPFIENATIRRPIFTPGQTPAMVHSNLPLSTPTQKIRRLRYRLRDTLDKVVSFEYRFPVVEAVEVVKKEEVGKGSGGSWIDELDGILEEMEREDRAREEMMRNGGRRVVAEGEDSVIGSTEVTEPVRDIAEGEPETLDNVEGPDSAAESSDAGLIEGGVVHEAQAELSDNVEGEESLPPLEDGSSMRPITALTAELSYITEVDLMIPDRPNDVRVTTKSPTHQQVPIPEMIERYFTAIQTQVDESGGVKSDISTPADLPQIVTLESGEEFLLEVEEEVEVNESTLPDSGVSVRVVRAKDLRLGVERTTTYTELHYPGRDLPISFWREFANASREVAPDAVSLKVKGDIFSGR